MDSHYLIDTYASSESTLFLFPDLQKSYTQLISHYQSKAKTVPLC